MLSVSIYCRGKKEAVAYEIPLDEWCLLIPEGINLYDIPITKIVNDMCPGEILIAEKALLEEVAPGMLSWLVDNSVGKDRPVDK